MTRTLLLTLAGPQQAWGTSSRFATRATEHAPTRSGVIGLVAAALGLDRTAPLDRFRAVLFGVRIDRPGRIERDFQTARTLDGKTSMPLSHRYFLADAVFVAGLASEDDRLLDEIQAALRKPRYPLYLGRRAFPPAGPIPTELVDADLRTALTDTPWRKPRSHRGKSRSPSRCLSNSPQNSRSTSARGLGGGSATDSMAVRSWIAVSGTSGICSFPTRRIFPLKTTSARTWSGYGMGRAEP